MNYDLTLILDKSKIKQVLLLLPLHREGLTSYLSPLLGQYGIRNSDFVSTFIATFNKQTNNIFEQDINGDDIETGLSDEVLTVPIYLTIYKGNKYTMSTGFSLIGTLYQSTFKRRRRFYRKGNFYRNYKKLFLLAVFSKYISERMQFKQKLLLNKADIRLIYKEVRNSVHRKT